jgi:hypothetical protein
MLKVSRTKKYFPRLTTLDTLYVRKAPRRKNNGLGTLPLSNPELRSPKAYLVSAIFSIPELLKRSGTFPKGNMGNCRDFTAKTRNYDKSVASVARIHNKPLPYPKGLKHGRCSIVQALG